MLRSVIYGTHTTTGFKGGGFSSTGKICTWLNNIIIMYIYHALINALSAHMIHINLNMIFYTRTCRA